MSTSKQIRCRRRRICLRSNRHIRFPTTAFASVACARTCLGTRALQSSANQPLMRRRHGHTTCLTKVFASAVHAQASRGTRARHSSVRLALRQVRYHSLSLARSHLVRMANALQVIAIAIADAVTSPLLKTVEVASKEEDGVLTKRMRQICKTTVPRIDGSPHAHILRDEESQRSSLNKFATQQ